MVGIEPSHVHEGLWLGSCPRSPEDFEVLAGLGVTDVVSLIPPDEAGVTGLQPTVAFRLAVASGLKLHSGAIRDFSHRELAARLPVAVAALSDLLGAGRVVYLHCAHGFNRSPTVAAAWLATARAVDAVVACAQLQALRQCAPDVDAVKAFLRER